jgi:hypothetical protein
MVRDIRSCQAFIERLDARLFDDVDQAVERVRCYFLTFAGRRFDEFGRTVEGLDVSPYRFTNDDARAVVSLSMNRFGKRRQEWVIADKGDRFAGLLEKIPVDVCIFDRSAGPHIVDEAPAERLWTELLKGDGIGWVTANKLIAHKRPLLILPYDNVWKSAMNPPKGRLWSCLHEALALDSRSDERKERLEMVRTEAVAEPNRVSLLRILDVMVWMMGAEI